MASATQRGVFPGWLCGQKRTDIGNNPIPGVRAVFARLKLLKRLITDVPRGAPITMKHHATRYAIVRARQRRDRLLRHRTVTTIQLHSDCCGYLHCLSTSASGLTGPRLLNHALALEAHSGFCRACAPHPIDDHAQHASFATFSVSFLTMPVIAHRYPFKAFALLFANDRSAQGGAAEHLPSRTNECAGR